jgi:hypothetical protein
MGYGLRGFLHAWLLVFVALVLAAIYFLPALATWFGRHFILSDVINFSTIPAVLYLFRRG